MANHRTVWTDEEGDVRKKSQKTESTQVDLKNLVLELRRLTSGKGRTVIEIKGLPKNKKWCQTLAKDIKKMLGVGGTFKNDYIEIHGENIERVMELLDKRSIRWKKTGG